MNRLIAVLLMLWVSQVSALTEYRRIVGISEDPTIPVPAAFSIIVATDTTLGWSLVLSHTILPQNQSVVLDTTGWKYMTIMADEDQIVSYDGVTATYNTVDAFGDSLTGFYTLSILPYNLIVRETITPVVAAVAQPTTAAKSKTAQLMSQIKNQLRRRALWR